MLKTLPAGSWGGWVGVQFQGLWRAGPLVATGGVCPFVAPGSPPPTPRSCLPPSAPSPLPSLAPGPPWLGALVLWAGCLPQLCIPRVFHVPVCCINVAALGGMWLGLGHGGVSCYGWLLGLLFPAPSGFGWGGGCSGAGASTGRSGFWGYLSVPDPDLAGRPGQAHTCLPS